MTKPKSLLETMEDAANGVAALTGIKAQLVAAGWSSQNAELMVIELVRANA